MATLRKHQQKPNKSEKKQEVTSFGGVDVGAELRCSSFDTK